MRAWHKGELIPGKFNPTWNSAYISYNGAEIRKNEFEVSSNFINSLKNSLIFFNRFLL